MKKFLILCPLATLLLTASCKKDSDIKFNFPSKLESTATTSGTADNKLAEVFLQNAPKSERFSVNAATGGTITTSKGSNYIIQPNSFVYADGTPVTGNVDIQVKEITSPSEMILGDKPTIASDGSMLKSFGEFKVEASQGNNIVLLKPKAILDVAVLQVVKDTFNGVAREIPMWDGDTLVQLTSSERDFENNPVTLTVPLRSMKGIDWKVNNDFAVSNNNQLRFPIDKLGNWVNCDALVPNNNPTTVICYFNNIFNDSSLTSTYQGLEPNLLFFKQKGENTLIKLYNRIYNPPAGKSGFISYQNKFNIGLEGTFLAIVYKGGKFYAVAKDVTIGSPASGKTFFGIDLTLEEVTESQMLALIASMNTK